MTRATITRDFWYDQLEVNANSAIFHQWDQLVASGCIENFRIAAGQSDGFRTGWFFADSDAYKWLDAASRVWAGRPEPRLEVLMDEFIVLLAAAQSSDGYLFTYNQIFFPETRWQNLQIEHELYCHGHLIEAGVSHYSATGRPDLLDIARPAADRIYADFSGKGPAFTPGHEEIEIALLRLHEITPGDTNYLDLARQFIEQRGRNSLFPLSIIQQNIRVGQRSKLVARHRENFLAAHPDFVPYQMPPGNTSQKPALTTQRWYASALSGKYFQQHAPIREQTVPVGHAVRFAYLETATAMLARLTGDRSLLPALESAWEHMVTRRMYVTGGIGSLPGLEGFGRDYELDPEYAYAETCAALGSMFWIGEMAQITGAAKYSDLFEWQLYNAALVGMGLEGDRYLYNNPLTCHGEVNRQPWYAVPCCPSNISRTWADLERYIYTTEPGQLTVHQYISSELQNEIVTLDGGAAAAVTLQQESGLPWQGKVRIVVNDLDFHGARQDSDFSIRLRRPSWSVGMKIMLNGTEVALDLAATRGNSPTASGYDPRLADFISITRAWAVGDGIEIEFEMPIQTLRVHPKVKGHRGKAAVTRGPLVYCLEDGDNPGIDIFSAVVDVQSLIAQFDAKMLGGIIRLQGRTTTSTPLTWIPYFRWGNRGSSQMTVWVNV